jgi:PAS domain S-box-containing protein
MNLAVILFVGGAVVIAWIFLWARQREGLPVTAEHEPFLDSVPGAASSDAVIVSREHGQVVYANPPARHWLGLNGGLPHLEQIASAASPSDSFLELLAHEGQASFQLGSRWVSASSHRIPSAGESRMVVVMRELTTTTSHPEALNLGLAMSIINEIGETVNAAMGVNQVLQTLLDILGKAIHFDAGEICLWDAKERVLRQRGWVGDAMYLIRLAEAGGKYDLDEGISGWVARQRKPILIHNLDDPTAIQPKLMNSDYRSFIAVPLMLGDRFIGTLELAHQTPGHFNNSDLALLQALSKPVTVSVYNAEIYAEQTQRIDDLASLQQLASEHELFGDASPVYAAVNRRVAELLTVDMCGIFLHDPDRSLLIPQPPFVGLPEALVRTIVIPVPADSPQFDIWDRQASWVSNDVIDEPLVEALGLKPVVGVAGISNTAWVPLQISGRRIGVLAVSNKRTEGGFSPRDVQNLMVLAAQVAIIVENIRLYQREQRIDAELVGLQEITHAIGALSHEGEFYFELTERIARLMNISMCGILLYDPPTSRLISKLPFFGIPNHMVQEYQIVIRPGSAVEELWLDEDYWVINNVQTNALVYEVGLDELAESTGVQKTMFAALSASGRRIGVVQVSNKLNGEDFTDADARLLLIFAAQAAAIIENARLYREAQRSAEEAQGLRRVAELAGAVVTTQETFAPVLAEVARLMNSDIVFINVLEQTTGSLVTYPRWVYGMELVDPIVQDIYAPGFENSVAVSHEPYLGNDVLNDARVLPSYKHVAQRMSIVKAIIVPLMVGDRTLGELGIANRLDGNYTRDDLKVLGIVAAQTAAALDRLLLYEATGQNLNRRLEELDAISRISNELTSTVELDPVLNAIIEEAVQATDADDGTIALVLPSKQWKNPESPVLERRLGRPETTLLMYGLADIEVEAVLRAADSVLITDYEFSVMEAAPPTTRSAVAAPILYLDQIVGVIHLYHHDPSRFDDRAAAFLSTLATKAALGYSNSVRYREQLERSDRLRRRVEQLNRIFELGHMFYGDVDPTSILEAIAYSVQTSVGFDTVVMLLLDEKTGALRRVAQAGLPVDMFERSRRSTINLAKLNELFKDKYRISESYFYPVEEVGDWYVEHINALSTSFDGNRTIEFSGRDGWRDGDMLLVTLKGYNGQTIGLMSLDRPHDNRRPDRFTIEVLEIFAHQAATTIENARLYREVQRSADQEGRLNEMIEMVASTLDLDEVARSVARGMLRLVPFNRMTLALAADRGFDMLRLQVTHDESLEMEKIHRMTLDRTALGRTYHEGLDHLYQFGDPEIGRYEDLQTWYEAGERVSLIMPLLTGGQEIGVLHLGAESGAEAFAEARGLMRRIGQLVASSIQNARLFNQAVNLQVLNESVLESIQQGIVVLDPSGRIVSANGFMNTRYAWTDDAIGMDLFGYQPELAAVLAEDIRQALEHGQQMERDNQTTAMPDGSIAVRNYYTYPLRFGDTIRGAVLLVEDVTERSRLEEAMEQRAKQLEALTEVSTRITSSLERDEVVTLAMNEMGWLIGFDTMSLWRRNGSYMVLEGRTGPDGAELLRQEDIRVRFADFPSLKQMVETQRVVEVGQRDKVTDKLPGQEVAESWMAVPLVNQGHVIGLVALTSSEKDAYSSRSDQNIAQAFASQVAIALANADLFEQTFDRTNELGTLLEAAQATSITQDLDSVFRTVVELMFNALDMDDCAIMIWDEVDNELEVQVDMNRYGDVDRITARGTRFDLRQYPARLQALREREVIVIMRDEPEPMFPNEVEELHRVGDAARMFVPLVVREQSIGLIQLEQKTADKVVTQQKVRLARALGAQVAVAIENARLNREMSDQFGELMVINELSRAISSTLDLNEMMEVVASQVPSVTGADELYLALYEEMTQDITFPLAVQGERRFSIAPRKLGNDEVSFIIRHRNRPLSLGADYYSPDELRRSLGIVNGEGDVRSYLGVPIESGNEVLGVLAIRDRERTRAFTLNEQRILLTVSSQLGAAIQNARLFEKINNFAADLEREVAQRTQELEDERDRIDTLYQITAELGRTLDMERLLGRALGMVAKAVSAQDGAIMQMDPVTDQLYSSAVLNPNSMQLDQLNQRAFHPAEVIGQWLIDQDEHFVMIDQLEESEFWDSSAPGAAEWRSALAVLLEANEDPVGVMVLLSRDEAAFAEPQLRLMVAAANQVAAAINNADLYLMIKDQAERLGALLRTEQEEADKSAAILEGIADGVILADASGNVLRFNPAAERILGVPRDQALNQPLAKLTGVAGEAIGGWVRASQSHANESETGEYSRIGDYIDERLDLGGKTVSVHLSPVYTGNKFLGTVSVFRDITRDVEVERMKSDFITRISHEFRTPLTPIKGYADLLLMGAAGAINDGQKSILGTVKENVDRLAVLVEDVLEIAELDRGRDRVQAEPVDLPELVERVLQNVRNKANNQRKTLVIDFNAAPETPEIMADRDKITRVLTNVIDNAFNYTLDGGTIEIRLKPETARKHVMLSVQDTGVGIPEEFYDRIWRRFERHEDTARELGVAGTGLGLAIARELVEMHGGDIWFDSRAGIGTTFFISLPIDQPEYLIASTSKAAVPGD